MTALDPLLALREDDPASDLAPDPAAAARMDAGLERLLRVPPRRRTRAPRRLVGAVALVAAAVGGVFLVPAREPEPASAATVLARLGSVVSGPEGDGRYAYERREQYITHMGQGFAVVLPHEEEQWLREDGTGVVRTKIHEDRPSFPTSRDREAWEALPERIRPSEIILKSDGIEVAGFTPRELRELPADPAALRAKLERTRIPAENRVVAAAGTLLSTALTPVPVKRALFEVLRGLPGARVVDDARDPRGRTGVAVEFSTRAQRAPRPGEPLRESAWRTLFIFDPEDGSLLATRSIGTREMPGRDIEDWSVVIESGRRDSAPPATGPFRARRAGPGAAASR